MKKAQAAKLKEIVTGMTLADVESLFTEIADYTLTIDDLQSQVAAIHRKLDEKQARLVAKVEPVVSQKNTALLATEKAREERVQVLEMWAETHKANHFAEPRSMNVLRGVFGFRQSPPTVGFIKGFTAKLSAVLLRKRKWGREYLQPAKISHEAILRDEGEFLAHPERLVAVGLTITRQDHFYYEVARTGSDTIGKEAA